jgi:hypothetical protein
MACWRRDEEEAGEGGIWAARRKATILGAAARRRRRAWARRRQRRSSGAAPWPVRLWSTSLERDKVKEGESQGYGRPTSGSYTDTRRLAKEEDGTLRSPG